MQPQIKINRLNYNKKIICKILEIKSIQQNLAR